MYTKLCLALLTLFPFETVMAAAEIEKKLVNTSDKITKLFFAAAPLFALNVAWHYKRGKPEAKEKMENFLIGLFIVAAASGFVYYVK